MTGRSTIGIFASRLQAYQPLATRIIGELHTPVILFGQPEKLEMDLHYLSLILIEIDDDDKALIAMVSEIKRQVPQAHIILLNGSIQQAILAQAFKYGISDYFPAPIDFELLYERISVILRRFDNSAPVTVHNS